MTLPRASVATTPGRDVLPLAADWFRREAQAALDSKQAAIATYGADAVSIITPSMLYAAANMIDRVARTDLTGARLAAAEFREAFSGGAKNAA